MSDDSFERGKPILTEETRDDTSQEAMKRRILRRRDKVPMQRSGGYPEKETTQFLSPFNRSSNCLGPSATINLTQGSLPRSVFSQPRNNLIAARSKSN